MNDGAFKSAGEHAAPRVSSLIVTPLVDQAPTYTPNAFDRLLDRAIDVLDVMPGLPALGAALILAVIAGLVCGLNFTADDVPYSVPTEAVGINVDLPTPADEAPSAAAR